MASSLQQVIEEVRNTFFTNGEYSRLILLVEEDEIHMESGFLPFTKIQDNVFVSKDTHCQVVIEQMLERVLKHSNFLLADTRGGGSNLIRLQ